MSDPIFLVPKVPRPSLGELVAATGSEVAAGVDLAITVSGAAALEDADRGDLAFFDHPSPASELESTRATACFVAARHRHHVPPTCVALVTEAPTHAFAIALALLFPRASRPGSAFATAGANPGALIHPEARLEPGVIVDPGAVIGPRAEIGQASIIGAGSVIGPEVRIGRDCAIGAQVTIGHALIGDRVVLQPGARIGQDGFAFALGPRSLVKIPHIGRVVLQNDVEIGANTTIDRGTIRDTMIGEGTKIGNLVEVAAGVTIGRHCAVAAQVALECDARLDDFVAVGAKARVAKGAAVAAGGEVAAGASLAVDDERA